MSRAVSDQFLKAIGVSQNRMTVATCTLPNGDVLDLDIKPGASISARRGTGTQRTVQSLAIAPKSGVDLYSLLATPLAVFHITHGINYGAGKRELIPVFHGEAATGSMRIAAGDITLSLVDMWARVDRADFTEPFMPAAGTRASQIAAAITGAIPDAVIDIRADGGTSTLAGVWSGSRSAFITKMATDGRLEVAPDVEGVFVIREQPVIATTAAPAWEFKTGVAANIKRDSATRSKTFNKIYNTVVVIPANDSQSWARQVITLADTSDPRHPSNMGAVCAYEYRSPTLMTAVEAVAAGKAVLQQLLRATETATLMALSNPALEPGDTISIVHASTDTDPGFSAKHLLDSFDLNLDSGDMSTTSTDADPYLLEAA